MTEHDLERYRKQIEDLERDYPHLTIAGPKMARELFDEVVKLRAACRSAAELIDRPGEGHRAKGFQAREILRRAVDEPLARPAITEEDLTAIQSKHQYCSFGWPTPGDVRCLICVLVEQLHLAIKDGPHR